MIVECQKQGIPAPQYIFEAGGCTVEFFRHTDESLQQRALRINLRRVVLQAQHMGQVTNSSVQQLLGVSKSTATRYLNELDKLNYLQRSGTTGIGTEYVLKGLIQPVTMKHKWQKMLIGAFRACF